MENNNFEKNKDSIGALIIKIILSAISIAILIYVSVEINKILKPSSSNNSNKNQQNEIKYYKVNDTIPLGDLEMTISENRSLCWLEMGLLLNQYSPAEGCGFVSVDVSIYNPTNNSVDIPCVYCHYTDSLYCDYKVELVIDDEIVYTSGRAYGNKGFIGYYGTYIAKQEHSGIYAFEVPVNVYNQGKKFELKISYHKKIATILLREDK